MVSSSHATYAERDLGDATDDWKRALHSLRIARLLYGPQVKAAEPCDRPHVGDLDRATTPRTTGMNIDR